MLTADFHNAPLPLDVTNDKSLSAIDALIVINDLNTNGPRSLPDATEPVTEFIDSNGDDFVSSIDALLIINVLNSDREPPELNFALANDSAPQGTNDDQITNDPTLAGTLEDAAGVRSLVARIDNGAPFEIPIELDGTFQLDPSLRLDGSDDGEHLVNLEATDTLGRSTTKALSFTLDTLAASATLDLSSDSDSGVLGDRVTNATLVDLEGATESNALIRIRNLELSAGEDGQFQVEGLTLDPGINRETLQVLDSAGNLAELEFRFANVDSEDAFGLLESAGFATEQVVPFAFDPTQPSRLRLKISADFDRSADASSLNDLLNVYVVNANDPNEVLLPGQSAGSPVVTLLESGENDLSSVRKRLTPGVSSLEGEDLLINLAGLTSSTPALRFEILSLDSDQASFALIESIEVEAVPASVETLTLAASENAIRPSGSVDLDQQSATEQLSSTLLNIHQVAPGIFRAELRIVNRGQPIGRDISLVARNLPDSIRFLDAESTDSDGSPILNLRPAVPGGGLRQGQSILVDVQIENPDNLRFPIEFDFFVGPPNSPPEITPVSPITLFPGGVHVEQIVALDDDGDALTFSIGNVPANAPTMSVEASTGKLEVRPEPGQTGDFELLLNVSDGAATTTESITIRVQADPIQTTRISGRVLDTDKNPIPGITANIGSTTTLTDAEGRFSLEEPAGGFDADALEIHGDEFVGANQFPFVAEKLPLLFPKGRDPFPNVDNVIDRAIYLPALDVAGGTNVEPANDVTVVQEIAPGEEAAVFVAANTLFDQQGDPFTGILSITEVPRNLTPAALPEGVFPGTVVTIQPGEMVFQQPAPLTLPNRGQFPPGTQLDLFSINPITGAFDNVGRGVVSNNGESIETIEGGIRNSSWHFFIPPIVEETNLAEPVGENENNQDELCNDCEGRAQTTSGKNVGTSEIELHSGALRESHALATYESLGATRGVRLQYNSQRVDLRPIVHFKIDNAVGDFLVATATVQFGEVDLRTGGAPTGLFGLEGGEHFWRIPAQDVSVNAALQLDLQGVATGVYPVEISHGVRQFNGNDFVGSSTLSTLPVTIINARNSPFGAGWEWSGFQHIVELEDGSALLVDGSGEQFLFGAPPTAGEAFVSPAGDFTTLEKLENGTYRRTTKDQTVYQFNADHQLESITDRNNNQTTMEFSDGRVTGFTDAVGLRTSFRYDADRIVEIEDPQGRITQLEHDAAGNLVRIVDPDQSSRQFEYDELHHLTAEINKRGFRETANYGFHGRVESVTRKDGSQSAFRPAQLQGLFPTSITANHETAPNAIAVNQPVRAQFVDPNGNVTTTTLDQAGQVNDQSDTEGNASRIVRNQDNLPATIIDGRGNETYFDYDEQGNQTRVRRSLFERPEGPFAGRQFHIPDDGLTTVALADLDGDGDMDAVGSGNRDRIYVLRNDGDSLFEVVLNEPSGGSGVSHLELVDLDGDNQLDILFTSDDGFHFMLGNGALDFGASQSVALGSSADGFTTGDFNEDDQTDVIVTSSLSNLVSVLLASGPATFDVATRNLGSGIVSRDAELVDINGDSHLDLLLATSAELLLFSGDGSGNLGTPSSISNVSATYSTLTTSDINLDGRLDVVAGSPSRLHVLLNRGNSDFRVQNIETGTGQALPANIVTADLNRDEFPEILLQTPDSSELLVFENLGSGVFDASSAIPLSAGARISGLDIADLNGDSDLEIVVSNAERVIGFGQSDPGGLTVLDGEAGGQFFQSAFQSTGLIATELADLTRDGLLDLVELRVDDGLGESFIAVNAMQNIGEYAEAEFFALGFDDASDFATGDFNADGILDAAAVSRSSGSVRILFGNLEGFEPPLALNFAGRGARIEAADLNSDGSTDLVATFSSPRRVITLLSNGDGSFQTNEIEADFAGTTDDAMLLRDVNGDGHIDVLGVTPNRFFAADNSIVLLNDGQGNFGAPVERGSDIDASSATVADLNNDGLMDLIVTGKGVSVRLANPDGTFAPAVVTPFRNDSKSVGLEIADFDGDGDLDVLTLDNLDHHLMVIPNDGSGALQTPQRFVAGTDPDALFLADFDLDGDQDALIANGSDLGTMLLENFSQSISPDNHQGQVLAAFDPTFNQATQVIDELQHETILEIDPTNGNMLAITRVIGERDSQSAEDDDLVEQFTYSPEGLETTAIDPLGRTTRTFYNNQGLVEQVIFAEGTADEATRRFEYDTAGNLTAEIDEAGHRTEFEYDALNRPTLRRNALGDLFTYEYNAAGSLVRTTDEEGSITRFEYDTMDRLIKSTDALGGVTQLEYDAFGNVLREIDRLGRVTEFRYDSRDRLIESIDPLGHSSFFTYDASDNLISATDRNGNASLAAYDAANRNILKVDALQGTTTQGFDARSSVVFKIDELGRRTDLFYDEVNRLTEIHHPDPDGDGGTPRPVWQMLYDKAGNKIEEVDPLGNSSFQVFDHRDRLVEVIGNDPDGNGPLPGPSTFFEFDSRSLIVLRTDSLGRVTETDYDALRRIQEVREADPDRNGPLERPVTTTEYDAVGNVITQTDPLGNQTHHQYDALHRRIQTTLPDPDGDGPLAAPVKTTTYDAEDQIVRETDALQRTTSYTYDALGRRTQFVAPDPDGLGPLESPTTHFRYDPEGNLIATIDPRGFETNQIYDALNRVVETHLPDPDGDGPQERPVQTTVYDAASQTVARIDPLGRRTDVTLDHLGRIVQSIGPDPDGNGPDERPVTSFEIDAVGNITATIDPLGNRTETTYDNLHRVIETQSPDPDGDGPEGSPIARRIYDAAGQIVELIDPLGRSTTFAYDDLGQLIQVTDPDPDGAGPLTAPTTQYAYDTVGNRTLTRDSLGNETHQEYDNLYRLIREIAADPDGNGPQTNPEYRFEYDVASQLIRKTDPLGRPTEYRYDGLSRRIETIAPDPDGDGPASTASTHFEYDAAGNRTAFTNSLGNTTRFVYDGLDREIRKIDADPDGDGPLASPVTSAEYDAANQRIATTDPLGRTTEFLYDGLGRVIQTTQPDPDGDGPLESPFSVSTYDLVGNELSRSDALGNSTEFEYDNLYRRTKQIDALGAATQIEFDLAGRRTALVDPLGNRTEWTYDDLDREIQMSDPLGSTLQMEYDSEDNLLRKTDRLGRVIEYDYDNLYRRTTERWLDNGATTHAISYAYDVADQLLAVEDAFSTIAYDYDGRGRKSQETTTHAGTNLTLDLSLGYDSENRLTSHAATINDVADFTNQYQYDRLNRRTEILQFGSAGGNDVADKRIDFTYDIASQLQTVTRFEDLGGTETVASTRYTFDDASRLTSLTHDQDTNTFVTYAWEYDRANRKTAFSSSQDGTADYTHDPRNQLTEVDYSFQEDLAFTFDQNGNRVGPENAVGSNNRTTSDGDFDFEYDAEGNRLRRTHRTTGQVTEYDWDHRNRLVSVTDRNTLGGSSLQQVIYHYDAFNRWIGKDLDPDGDGPAPTETTRFFYEGQSIVLEFNGSEASDLANRHLWGSGVDQLLATESLSNAGETDQVLWALNDELGSVRNIVEYDDASDVTSIVNHIQYDAFGNVTSESNANVDLLFAFTGRPYDSSTDLQNNLNRWYDATLGKWMTEDPIQFEAGDPNLYRYVGNAPLSITDPDGLDGSAPISALSDSFFGTFDFESNKAAGVVDATVSTVQQAGQSAAQAAKKISDEGQKVQDFIKQQHLQRLRFNESVREGVQKAIDAGSRTDPTVIRGRLIAKLSGVKQFIPESVAREVGSLKNATHGAAKVQGALATSIVAKTSRVTKSLKESRAASRTAFSAFAKGIDAAAAQGGSIAAKGFSAAASVTGKALGAVGAAVNFVKSIPVVGKVAGGVLSGPAQIVITATEISVALGEYIYVSEQKEAIAEEFRQHQENLKRLAVELYNQKMRAKNEETRKRNDAIRLERNAEFNARIARDANIENDIVNAQERIARKEAEFIADQRKLRQAEAKTGVPPVVLPGLLGEKQDNENEQQKEARKRRRPPTVSTTGGQSPLDLFFELAGQHDPNLVVETQQDCPPIDEED